MWNNIINNFNELNTLANDRMQQIELWMIKVEDHDRAKVCFDIWAFCMEEGGSGANLSTMVRSTLGRHQPATHPPPPPPPPILGVEDPFFKDAELIWVTFPLVFGNQGKECLKNRFPQAAA